MAQTKKTLVILHLYYTDMWPYFEKKLRVIGEYELIITMPEHKRKETPKDIISRPNTRTIYSKNRGRDILPFLSAMKAVNTQQYGAILKLHTKKSPHYNSGDRWLDQMVESLVALSKHDREKLFDESCSMIGPRGHYYSLVVNYEANGVRIDRVMKKFVGKKTQHEITQVNRSKYGFFGGSMFWIHPEYLEHILTVLKPHRWQFEREAGQVDGTYAHAIERIFSLVAEAEGKKLYDVDSRGQVTSVPYASGQVPAWSDHYEQ